jgi:benzoate membrane transport protein
MRLSLVSSAVVATLVGFGGTVTIILEAARATGADAAQAASWVMGVCVAMGVTTAWLSWRHRIPVITAWSTPGAALLAAAPEPVGMPAAAGAFLLAGALITATAAFPALQRLVERIPMPIAAAMLAGILVKFAIALFAAAGSAPSLVLPLLALFLLVRLKDPALAVLAVLAGGIALAAIRGEAGLPSALPWPWPVPVVPSLAPDVLIGVGLPLFLVTMAAQNLPGFAVLRAAGYPVPARSILAVTGIASLLSAVVGAHSNNAAAITAAICTGPDTHPDPARRWPVGLVYGACALLLALLAGGAAAVVAALPAALVATVAGTALLGPLTSALGTALGSERERFAAVVTLALSASPLSLLGIGPAFWGLIAGLVVLAAERLRRL